MSGTEKDLEFRLPKPSAQGLRGQEHAAAAFFLRTTFPLTKTVYDSLGAFHGTKTFKI